MKKIFFVSDVHLGLGSEGENAVRQKRLLLLFEQIRQHGSALYIIGDLFDFWYEYRSVLPRGYHNILHGLGALVESGIRVVYLAGNHDFAIGSFFSQDLGIEVIYDDCEFIVNEQRFYLHHGDGLAVRDGGYRFMKKILRSGWAQWSFRLLHPDLGFRLARFFSDSSRDYTTNKFYGHRDGMKLEAEKRIAGGADFVIMGHRHIALLESLGGGTYINLGDWIHFFTYAEYADGVMQLHTMRNDRPEVYVDNPDRPGHGHLHTRDTRETNDLLKSKQKEIHS